MLSAFVFVPFLMRQFGLEDYGLYLLVLSIAGYLVLLDLGFGSTVVKFTAEHLARGEQDQLGRLVTTAYAFYSLVGMAAALVLIGLSVVAPTLFDVKPDSQVLVRNLFLISAVGGALVWPLSVGSYVLSGMQEYVTVSRVGALVVLGNITMTVIVLLVGEGPAMLLGLTTVVSVAGGTCYSVMAWRRLMTMRVAPHRPDRHTLRRLAGFSSHVFVMQLSGIIMYQQTDRLVLGVAVGPAEVSRYEPVAKLYGLFSQVSNMLATALLPAAAQLDAQQRGDVLERLLLRGSKYVTIVIAPAATALVVLGAHFLTAWLGVELTPQQILAGRLFVGVWIIVASVPVVTTALLGAGHARFLSRLALAQAIANLLLSIFLVAVLDLGVLGVVIGTVLTQLAGLPALLGKLKRAFGVFPSTLGRELRFAYLLLPAPAAVAFAASQTPLMNTLVGVIAAGALAVFSYWLLAYRYALDPTERYDAREMRDKALIKLGIGR